MQAVLLLRVEPQRNQCHPCHSASNAIPCFSALGLRPTAGGRLDFDVNCPTHSACCVVCLCRWEKDFLALPCAVCWVQPMCQALQSSTARSTS